MPYVLLTLAVIAGAAAVFLWYLDSKQRRTQHQDSPAAVEPAEQEGRTTTGAALADDSFSDELVSDEFVSDEPGTTEEHAEWSAQASYGDVPIRGRVLDDEELATAEQLPQHDDVLDGESAADDALDSEPIADDVLADDYRDETVETDESVGDIEEADDAVDAADALTDDSALPEQETDVEQRPELRQEPEPAPELESEPEQHPTPVAKPAGPRRDSIIPGALRRERRQWAEKNGFSFAKHDDYLVDEWTRGAAAGGAAPKDIVQGSAYGHEMVLMDLGGVNVITKRTGAATEIVVDFRRADRDQRTDRTTSEISRPTPPRPPSLAA